MPLADDPFSMEFRRDPYPHYARLRAEDPVSYSESARMWVVSRCEDVVEVQILRPARAHRLRTIVNRTFTPRRVESWRPMVEHVTRECAKEMGQRSR